MNPKSSEQDILLNGNGAGAEEVYRFPCSVPQQACWYQDRLKPGSTINNIAVRFELKGSLSIDALANAFRKVIERHDVLRTTFVNVGNEPKQVLHAIAPFDLDFEDLSLLPGEQRQAVAERMASEYARVPFDIESRRLLVARLIQLEAERFMLLVNLHHIVSDGWSVGILTDELGEFYEALVDGRDPKLAELEIQYPDYSVWQREALDNGEFDTQLEYWRQKLQGFEPINLRIEKPRPDGQTLNSGICSLVLPRTLTDQLGAIGSRNGQSLFVCMLGGFLAMLHHESGQTDLALRTITAGRTKMELEGLIGWFANPVILRCDLSGDPSFPALSRRLDEMVVEASSNLDVPFEIVLDKVEPGPVPPRHPLFQVNLIYQKDFVKPWKRAGVSMTALPSKSVGGFVDLNFFLVEREDGWRASVEVSHDVFHPETGDVLLRSFQKILELIVAAPHATVSELLAGLPKALSSVAPAAVEAIAETEYVAPRNALEREIAGIWEKALRKSPIGVKTNFFDLGGYSLLATQILAKIQKRFGQELALGDLFQDPTVAATAARISEAMGTSGAVEATLLPVIHVQPEGNHVPFIMVAADHWFRLLAVHTGLDQPFVGISFQPYKVLPVEPPREQVIADVVATIRSFRPQGPYLLGGWCADGITAFDVARELQAGGAEIGMVAVFDAMNPEYAREFRSLRQAADRVAKSMWGLLKNSRQQRKEFVDGIQTIGHRVTDRFLSLFRANYACPPVDFPVVVLRPPVGPIEDGELGWRRVAGDKLRVAEVPGDHVSIFREPHVRELGQALRRHLLEVHAELDNSQLGSQHASQDRADVTLRGRS